MAKFTWTVIRTDGTEVPLTKDTDLTDTPIIRCNGLCFEVGIPESCLPEEIDEVLRKHQHTINGMSLLARLPSNKELEQFKHLGQWKAYELALSKYNAQDFIIEWFDFYTQECRDTEYGLGTCLAIYDLEPWHLKEPVAESIHKQIARNKERLQQERQNRLAKLKRTTKQ